MLYFAEKLLYHYYELPFSCKEEINDVFAKQFDMTVDEVRKICDQFEHDKLIVCEDVSVEIEDNKYDNNMTSELSYDALVVNKKEVEKQIKYLRERYCLRQRPFVPRGVVVSIAEQIERVFTEGELMRVVATFSKSGWQLRNKEYTITDLLFRHAYSKDPIESFPSALAEFLNPIYYNIHNKKIASDLFEYIDGVLFTSAGEKDYQRWLKEATRYVSIVQKATNTGVNPLAQKVIHEHIHRFENSIQEKGIDLNHKYENDNPNTLYITKKNDDFYYKGKYLDISKTAEYYQVFYSLFAKLPNGGEVSYKDLIAEIKSRMPEQKNKTNDEMRKFIQRNLTDKNNGFKRYAEIPKTEDNGKPLIAVVRGSGIVFNNKAG